MIVERIEVRNWRGLRDRHVFDFEEGINLLVGKNEAGKSTLFEALQRTLFDRHSTQAKEVKDVQPLGSSLAPEAEVTVTADGSRYRIRKRFLDGAESVFSVERNGSWEREHEGDRADEEARKLVDGDVPGRGATKVEHRGLGQALWYLQREHRLPDEEWNEAIQQGLGGILDVTTSAPPEKRILDRVRDAYGEHWTPKTAKLSANSPVQELEEEIEELKSDLDEKRSRLQEADDLREELEDLAAQRDEYEAARSDAEGRRDQLRERLSEVRELEDRREEAKRSVEEAEREVRETREDLDRLARLDAELEEIQEELETAREETSDAEHRAEAARKAAAEARKRRRDELVPARTGAARELEGLRALRRIRELEDRIVALEVERDEITGIQEELDTQRSELRELQGPSEEELDRYREAESELALLEARMEASAIRVTFDFDGEPQITSEPEAETEGDAPHSYLVTEPTSFGVGEMGTVSVAGVGATLEDLRDEAREYRDTLVEIEDRYDADDGDDLEVLFQRRKTLSGEVERLEDRAKKRRDLDDVEDELATVREEVDAATERTKPLADEQRGLTGDALEQAIGDLEDRQEELEGEIEDVESREEEASERHESLRQKVQESAQELSSAEARANEKRRQREGVISEYGTRGALQEQHTAREEELDERSSRLEELEEEFEEKVEQPRDELERTEDEIDEIRERVQELEQKAAGVQGRIEEIADQGVYADAGDLEAKLEQKRRRLEVLRRRAEGAKVAKQLLDGLQEGRRQELAGPVSEHVDRWVEVLTGGRYDHLEVDENLHPQAVRHTTYDAPLDVDQLSFGTQEQVVVLFRLAVGTVLAEEERQLVILDDRLVNADSVRTRRLCQILDDAADSCQILLATCVESRYARLNASKIRVPDDGRVDAG